MRANRAPAVGHLAPAVLEESEALDTVRGQLVEHTLADLAVEHAVGVLGITEQERQLKRRRLTDEAVEGGRPGLHDLDASAAQQVKRLRARAEPAVRIDVDLDATVGALLH